MPDGINPPQFEEPDYTKKGWFSSIFDWIKRRTNVVSKTSTYSVAADVFWVRCDASAGAFQVNLPSALRWGGRQIGFIKTDNSANAVTVARAGSDTFVGGGTSKSLGTQGARLLVISNGDTVWDYLVSPVLTDGYTGSALTKADDTNVTLTLGGSPTVALLAASSITAGWTGTLAAARLNANVVQSVVDDTNVTGDIAAQALTLGWAGTLAAARLNANVVQSVVNDTNVTGSIATQALTLGWTGLLDLTRGGTGANLTASSGGIVYSGAAALAMLAGTDTAGRIIRSGANGAPAWSTATFPATATSGRFLLATSANVYGDGPAPVANGTYNFDATAGKVNSITTTNGLITAITTA